MTDRYGVQYSKTLDASREMIDVASWKGRVRVCADTYDLVAATVGINDRLFVAKIPSNAIIWPQSTVYFSALGAGCADVDFGDANDADNLADAIDMTNAGSASLIEQVAVEKIGKKLWELLGYTKDPMKELDLFLTFKGEPAANGKLSTVIFYSVD